MSTGSEEIFDALRRQLIANMGITVGILLTGGLVSFGILCISLLSTVKNPETRIQHHVLRAYLVALLFIVTVYVGSEFAWSNGSVIFHFPRALYEPSTQGNGITHVVALSVSATPVLGAILTDGLLVWRCHMIQKISLHPDKWQIMFWVLPACLWGLTFATGCTYVIIEAVQAANAGAAFKTIALVSNVALNIYATFFISIRLLGYRRLMMRNVGAKAVEPRYLRIATIFLESAAINVPITITVAVGFGLGAPFGTIMAPVAYVGQAFASIIIIHQVALGRAFDRKQGEELSQLVSCSEDNASADTTVVASPPYQSHCSLNDVHY
ncbi:hypothetical protein NP233_g4334 [Leucocoprinus birnbaumii]|uniref:Uncharacterized protein n=1 Tax=Leucocoprinus birnbaumii TaxID=56174 RepID=A0AAD5VV86_9AGAR|nr:hypothetical protein NP233_g4334 [Leucocoprinus birnbaumii]